MDWTQRLKFRHLHVLVALHAGGNLSRTAREMALTQPALSKWLREIEQEIGEPLFTRHARGLVPTPMCDLLARRARLVLNEMERTRAQIDDLRSGRGAKLAVGSTASVVGGVLPPALARLRTEMPQASVEVNSGHLDALLPRLREGRLDLLLTVLEPRDHEPGLVATPLYDEVLVAIARAAHPLQRARRVRWEQALRFPWIGPPAHSVNERELQRELDAAGHALPHMATRVDSVLLLGALLRQGDAIGFTAGRTAALLEDQGLLRRLRLPMRHPWRVVGLRREGPPEPVLASFLRILCELSGRPQPPAAAQ